MTDGTRKGIVAIGGPPDTARAAVQGSSELVPMEGWFRRQVTTEVPTPRDIQSESEYGSDWEDDVGVEDDPSRWEIFASDRQNRRELLSRLRERLPKKAGVNRDGAEGVLRIIETVLQPEVAVEQLLIELNDQFIQWQLREDKGWEAAVAYQKALKRKTLPSRTAKALEEAEKAHKAAARKKKNSPKNGGGSGQSTPTATPRGVHSNPFRGRKIGGKGNKGNTGTTGQ